MLIDFPCNSWPRAIPLDIATLLPWRQRLHSLLQHHRRELFRRDGHMADRATPEPAT